MGTTCVNINSFFLGILGTDVGASSFLYDGIADSGRLDDDLISSRAHFHLLKL